MKTILVPVDYSAVSNNAMNYAVGLALKVKAKIVLLHVYEVPLPMSEAPVMAIPPEVMEKENMDKLCEMEDKLRKRTGERLDVESIVREGFVVDQLLRMVKEKKADIIVMGITGAGAIKRAVIGSNATATLKRAHVPVLVIPDKARFGKADKIVYACDFEKVEDHSVLEPMWELARLFGSEIMVLNVKNNKVVVAPVEGAAQGIELERWLGPVKHSYWFAENPDITEAISDFAEKHKVDIIAMVPREHSFLESIVYSSKTRKMAYSTHVPLLSMHE